MTDLAKSKNPTELIVVAHPDDESIFFAGLILSELQNPYVVCITDGNADGQGEKRAQEWARALEILGVQNHHMLGFADVFDERLDLDILMEQLKELPKPSRVFTHGPLGEYGHPHHQDVCMAVHQVFTDQCPVYGVAHNCEAELRVSVENEHFTKKAKIFSEVYFDETKRFINLVPLTNTESFCRYSLNEVTALYEHFRDKKEIKKDQLEKLKWYWPYLQAGHGQLSDRPF